MGRIGFQFLFLVFFSVSCFYVIFLLRHAIMQQCCQVIVIAGFSVKFGAVEAISCPSSMMMGSFLLSFFIEKLAKEHQKKKQNRKKEKKRHRNGPSSRAE